MSRGGLPIGAIRIEFLGKAVEVVEQAAAAVSDLTLAGLLRKLAVYLKSGVEVELTADDLAALGEAIFGANTCAGSAPPQLSLQSWNVQQHVARQVDAALDELARIIAENRR